MVVEMVAKWPTPGKSKSDKYPASFRDRFHLSAIGVIRPLGYVAGWKFINSSVFPDFRHKSVEILKV